jgi:deoxyribonuclease-4
MRFGPSGYPKSSKNPEEAFRMIRGMGLDALEVGFVRGARIAPERAEAVGKAAAENGIRLSCHAPYFLSFNSDNPETREKSLGWVMDTVRAAHAMRAYVIVIHAATYGKSPETATHSVIEGLNRCRSMMDDEGIDDVMLGLETMGKTGAWGTLREISEVMDSVEGSCAVLDVAHVHARGRGCLRSEDDMSSLLEEFFPLAGDVAHFHISCIKYGDKGEISHLPLASRDPDLSLLASVLEDEGRDCTFICESPLMEADAVVFRDMFPKYRI